MRLRDYIYALATGGGLGLAWGAAERALVYKAFFKDNGLLGGKSVVMCTRHPGHGLLMWSNGDLQCYNCGKEKYSGKYKKKFEYWSPEGSRKEWYIT